MAAYSVQIGQIYDGPLDLLLDLIRKQDVDIYDIPIARITGQYLAYMERLENLEVEAAAEFLLMAATLIQIKSKMLLPRAPAVPGQEGEAEDPRDELVARLLEYEKFKQAAAMLRQKQQLEEASWARPGARDFREDAAAEPELAVELHDVTRAFQEVLRRMEERPRLELSGPEVTVAEMITRLRAEMARTAPLRLQALFAGANGRRALIVAFLAVLELVRRGEMLLRQERAGGEILLKPRPARAAADGERLPPRV